MFAHKSTTAAAVDTITAAAARVIPNAHKWPMGAIIARVAIDKKTRRHADEMDVFTAVNVWNAFRAAENAGIRVEVSDAEDWTYIVRRVA